MKKIEHIGIAVKDIRQSKELFSKIFNQDSYKSEVISSESVVTEFFRIGETKVELIASIDDSSSISKYLENHREGMHHIAFLVDDIYSEMDRIRSLSIRILNDNPKIGADKKLICFLHPKDTNGVLIEMCQKMPQ